LYFIEITIPKKFLIPIKNTAVFTGVAFLKCPNYGNPLSRRLQSVKIARAVGFHFPRLPRPPPNRGRTEGPRIAVIAIMLVLATQISIVAITHISGVVIMLMAVVEIYGMIIHGR
jgi:hypothetical protein